MSQDKIRVGFIGCGGNARGHGRSIMQAPDAEIVALADISASAIQAFRENVRGCLKRVDRIVLLG